MVHDGMQYDSIQGQCHEPLKVINPSILKDIFSLFIIGAGN